MLEGVIKLILLNGKSAFVSNISSIVYFRIDIALLILDANAVASQFRQKNTWNTQMKTLKETIYELVQNDNIRSEIKQIFKPFGLIIYNEIYFYILLILVYCGLLFLAVLGTLFYLINIHKKLSRLELNVD